MRTIVLRTFGPPEVLEIAETERPTPADGEVLLRVEAIGLNPVEAVVRSGGFPMFGEPPMVLGWDVAGVVEAIGPGVERLAVGDRAFGLPLFPQLARAYAEYVAVPASQLARPPAGLDAVHAAALPLAGLTAWQTLVGRAGLRRGQHVLIQAAGGGVGHLAVQIAKALGARVTATASQSKTGFVKSLGADTVIDYRTDDVAEHVHDVDVVLDPIGGEATARCVPVLRPGGTLVSLLRHDDEDAQQAMVEEAGRRYVMHLVSPDAEGLEALAGLVDEGKLRVHVDRVFGFDEIADAHRLLETSPGRGSGNGITGKLVLVP